MKKFMKFYSATVLITTLMAFLNSALIIINMGIEMVVNPGIGIDSLIDGTIFIFLAIVINWILLFNAKKIVIK